jgi:redox-sensitive bicupin YhaK (pirin superfamily)
MNIQVRKALARGTADHGWLKANFSFSFAHYFNPENIQFGMLRVLNDDTIAPGMGFGTHPHDNMEIITIPLAGGLRHRDSMGNEKVVSYGEVQVMSAGTGIQHSEMNASSTEIAKTLQIWVFPNQQNVRPRYDQKAFDLESQQNEWVTVISPNTQPAEGSIWIYQDCFFSLGVFDANQVMNYQTKIAGNGLYLFVIEGEVQLQDQVLGKRDAAEITTAASIDLKTTAAATLLLIEVPMHHN